MKKADIHWYRKIWSLSIKEMSWTENTSRQVDFIIHLLGLTRKEKILDLACGYGRHSIELARRGFEVTGVDITEEYVNEANNQASKENIASSFICDDIRNIKFSSDFDVVLNIADGAIGYLENDEENMKIFDRISEALRPGGKHFMDICNAKYAEKRFPMRNWEIGKQSLSLPEFDWDPVEKRMLYGGWDIKFGQIASPPDSIEAHSSIRLYSIKELEEILLDRNMSIIMTRADYSEQPASDEKIQIQIYSRKNAI